MKCIFCFGDNAKIHFDKKNRPYYFCGWCSHRIFFHSPTAYKAIMAWTETAKALSQNEFSQMIANMENNVAVKHEKVQQWMQEEQKILEEVVVSR